MSKELTKELTKQLTKRRLEVVELVRSNGFWQGGDFALILFIEKNKNVFESPDLFWI